MEDHLKYRLMLPINEVRVSPRQLIDLHALWVAHDNGVMGSQECEQKCIRIAPALKEFHDNRLVVDYAL